MSNAKKRRAPSGIAALVHASHIPSSARFLLPQTMGSAYEDMQAQNSRLLQKLTEKDEAHNQLLAERLKVCGGREELTGRRVTRACTVNRLHEFA